MNRLLVALFAFIAIASAVDEGYYSCVERGRLLEYKREKGTKAVIITSNRYEEPGASDEWHYSLDASSPFIWDGSHSLKFNFGLFPGIVDSISYTSRHRSSSSVFPQSALGNEYNTNQLISQDFDKVVDVSAYQFRQPLNVVIRSSGFKPTDDFFFSLKLKTREENGYPHNLWVEGTQFQRYNEGDNKECPEKNNGFLHNGFVRDTQCSGPHSVFSKCVGGTFTITETDLLIIGSGNPATSDYSHENSSCIYNIEMTESVKRSTGYVQIAFTWFGVAEGDSLIVRDSFGAVVTEYNGKSGWSIVNVYETKFTIEWITKGNSTSNGLDVFGWRAIVSAPVEGDCFSPATSGPGSVGCGDQTLYDCAVFLKSECATFWDESCVTAADICGSFYDAKLSASYDFPLDEIVDFVEECPYDSDVTREITGKDVCDCMGANKKGDFACACARSDANEVFVNADNSMERSICSCYKSARSPQQRTDCLSSGKRSAPVHEISKFPSITSHLLYGAK